MYAAGTVPALSAVHLVCKAVTAQVEHMAALVLAT
jgi:hypothetical protein